MHSSFWRRAAVLVLAAQWAAVAHSSDGALTSESAEQFPLVEFTGTPPRSNEARSLMFGEGASSGYVSYIANLTAHSSKPKLGLRRFFWELTNPNLGSLDGLRIFADQIGITGHSKNDQKILVADAVIGVRPDSHLDRKLGSVPEDAAIVSIERLRFKVEDQRSIQRLSANSLQPEERFEQRIEAEAWDIRLAERILIRLLHADDSVTELTKGLSSDVGMMAVRAAEGWNLHFVVGVKRSSRPILRISISRKAVQFDGQNSGFWNRLRIEKVADAEGLQDFGDSMRDSMVADFLADSINRLAEERDFVAAVQTAVHDLAVNTLGVRRP